MSSAGICWIEFTARPRRARLRASSRNNLTHIELASEFADDMDRIADHMLYHEAAHVEERLRGIVEAIQVLRDNPLIGRQTDKGERELVIGRGSHGYVALYRYVTPFDTVYVLAIRAQREGGYARNE